MCDGHHSVNSNKTVMDRYSAASGAMGTHTSPGEVMTQDAMFELVSNVRRRRLIYLLSATEGAVSLGELARQVAAVETDGATDDSIYWRVYISLYQTHVPRLERHGLVAYSDDEQLVASDEINGLMHLLEGSGETEWLWLNVALAVTVTAVFAYYVLAMHPDAVLATAVAILATTLLGVLSLGRVGLLPELGAP